MGMNIGYDNRSITDFFPRSFTPFTPSTPMTPGFGLATPMQSTVDLRIIDKSIKKDYGC